MLNLNRRDFFKLIGAGSIGTGAGFLLGESMKNPVELLIPYLIPPEDIVPGVATWYNTVCNQCGAGCGVMVKVMEGRAKKIEGNPAHPVNQGKLCPLGQAGLQVLYNPDRLRNPLKRTGERGSGKFQEIPWEEALTTLADRVGGLSGPGASDRVHLLSGRAGGHLDELFSRFMDQLGSRSYLQYEFAHPHNLYLANKLLFDEERLPYYDIKNTQYLLSFGADYLTSWLSPVHHGLSYGHMRQGRPGRRGKFVQVEPRLSLTGANADEWVPAKPGTEGLLALGIAHLMVRNGHYEGDDQDKWSRALDEYTPERVSRQTGVDAQRLASIAEEFARSRPSLAIGGGTAANHTNGVSNLVAFNSLNYLAGNLQKPGGILFNPPSDSPSLLSASPHKSQAPYARLLALMERLSKTKDSLLLLHHCNPLFNLPDTVEIKAAFQNAGMIVSLTNFMDESTMMADLVLPTHSYLESWGDDVPEPGVGFPVAAISQPVVAPLYDTRAAGDILLLLADKIGGDVRNALPWSNMEAYLKSAWKRIYVEKGAVIESSTFESFWKAVLQAGVWGETGSKDAPGVRISGKHLLSQLAYEAPRFAGDQEAYPYILHPFVSQAFHDGRGANLPWMQELPDPTTSVVYGSWVELNPRTAMHLGIREGDLLWVESPTGKIKVPAYLYPAIMPGVVAMPIGQGHSAYGQYAKGRGANPIQILAPLTDVKSGALAWAATRVRITKTGERVEILKTDGTPRELGRNITGKRITMIPIDASPGELASNRVTGPNKG
ncbi:molybdopterin-containing oxidoreductase family protein [Amphritea balenae]|uniref:Nitrate reductase n=1 Tax=Amphritea balenae TaxID=452629 RepID=A0A3P1SQZ7_9GAMM|nr:molybdopterin-dependent oxidoreductase [Amphritea balenae]RRC99324.1 nitrate reductase [Amphritea balenae]GGK72055.1 menaquinone reductase, molybdopterin-binding-like subunit [Amphritea balenae]